MDKQLAKDLAQAVGQFYETHGSAFSRTRHQHWDVFETIKDLAKPGLTLVDVGAGNGRLQEFLPQTINYIGIEPSSSLRDSNPSIQSGSLPNLPLGDGTADITTCLAVIHHLPGSDRGAAVDELVRITKPGGIILATSWNLKEGEPVEQGDPGDVWVQWEAEGAKAKRYVHLFTESEWKRLWTRPDLELETIGLDKNGLNRLVIARKT